MNEIELYIEPNINEDDLYNIIRQLNLFNDHRMHAYINRSSDLLIKNSIKNSTESDIKIYSVLFKIPDFNNLLTGIVNLSKEIDNNKEIIKITNSVFSKLFNYTKSNIHNELIGIEILESIVMNDNNKYNMYVKININSKKKYNHTVDKKKDYIQLFKYLKEINDKNLKIKFIKFDNEYIYNIYTEFKNKHSIDINPIYEDCIIAYMDSLLILDKSITYFNELTNFNLDTESISDYLTDNSISGNKYKAIKSMHLSVNQFDDTNDIWLPYQRINNILNNIEKIEKNIIKYSSSDINDDELLFLNHLADKIHEVNKYFSNNKNNMNANLLVNTYNNCASDFIKTIANTEPIDIDFVDPYIYDEFYNDMLDKYVVKIKSKNIRQYRYYIKSIFGDNTSLILNERMYYLHISFSILFFLFLVLYIREKGSNHVN